jgi:hypothetical protein
MTLKQNRVKIKSVSVEYNKVEYPFINHDYRLQNFDNNLMDVTH